ncbi:MAG: hypothetical protein GQF41_3944 [Candidatus Rifleibacterium amylolyticum]|nr:MAG: hypothetical protein GQF41_3944 [Candidatus Rifleibacterium amylolyticum]
MFLNQPQKQTIPGQKAVILRKPLLPCVALAKQGQAKSQNPGF